MFLAFVVATACHSKPTPGSRSSGTTDGPAPPASAPTPVAVIGSDWVTENPKLGRMLVFAQPPCDSYRRLTQAEGASGYHATYEAWFLAISGAELKKAFRAQAEKQGYSAQIDDSPDRVHATILDDSNGHMATLLGSQLMVEVSSTGSLRARAIEIARAEALVTEGLVASLGEDVDVQSISLRYGAEGRFQAIWLLKVREPSRSKVGAWATTHGLKKEGEWTFRAESLDASKPAIEIELSGTSAVRINEERWASLDLAACEPHPSYGPPKSPPRAKTATEALSRIRGDGRVGAEEIKRLAKEGTPEQRDEAVKILLDRIMHVDSAGWREVKRPALIKANAASGVQPTPEQLEKQLDTYRDEEAVASWKVLAELGGAGVQEAALRDAQRKDVGIRRRRIALEVAKRFGADVDELAKEIER